MVDAPLKYRVIVSGVVLPEKSRAEVIEQLTALFHSRRDTMEKLLQGKATPLAKEYDLESAEKICRAIREAGAECRMEEIGAPEVSPVKDAPEDDSAQGESQRDDSSADAELPNADHQDHRQGTRDEAPPAETEAASQDTSPEAALMRFVAVNTAYYGRQFAKFGDIQRPSFALSWHWPAFLVFFFWALYRKLWLLAGINLAGKVVLVLWVNPGMIYLGWALFWALAANYLYFRHARSRVLAGPDPGNTPDAAGGPVDSVPRGGVSRGAVWMGVVVMLPFSMLINNLLAERILEQYAERVGGTLLDPGSRQRGDGSAIDDFATLEPGAAKTMTALGVLAATLKLAASRDVLDDSQQALSEFELVIEQKNIKDAWGGKITLRQDASGQVVLISAGPDGNFGNEDDLLQYVRLDGS